MNVCEYYEIRIRRCENPEVTLEMLQTTSDNYILLKTANAERSLETC